MIFRTYPGETKEDTGFTGQAGQAEVTEFKYLFIFR